jgi:hypothetical protein
MATALGDYVIRQLHDHSSTRSDTRLKSERMEEFGAMND